MNAASQNKENQGEKKGEFIRRALTYTEEELNRPELPVDPKPKIIEYRAKPITKGMSYDETRLDL